MRAYAKVKAQATSYEVVFILSAGASKPKLRGGYKFFGFQECSMFYMLCLSFDDLG